MLLDGKYLVFDLYTAKYGPCGTTGARGVTFCLGFPPIEDISVGDGVAAAPMFIPLATPTGDGVCVVAGSNDDCS